MQKIQLLDQYPVLTTTIGKGKYKNIDEIFDFLKQKIESHPIAVYVGEFDNYEHTNSLGGKIEEGIIGAKNIMFCFGKAIPKKAILAVRPRVIGVVESEDEFFISYLKAPNEELGVFMEQWIKELK